MMKYVILPLVLMGLARPAMAAEHRVSGSGLLLTTAQKAKDGDTVVFAPGTYYECASWKANNLTLKAEKPGTAIFDGVSCEGKAIFVISGANIVVDGLVFKNAKVPDGNGAGIRAEGRNLTVRNSKFIDNENGILSALIAAGDYVIDNSVFDGNGGCGNSGGCSHGIYINGVDRLTIRKSTFINTHIGHHIKTRAKTNLIENVLINDGPKGDSSYLIEFPNGGNATVRNSVLTKGPKTDNRSTFIFFAAEGLTNPTQTFLIENVSFTNRTSSSPSLVRGAAGPPPVLRNIKTSGSIGAQFTR